MVDASAENARDIELDLDWFAEVLDARIRQHFKTGETSGPVMEIPPPELGVLSWYSGFVRHYELSAVERMVMLLALIPHVRPQLLDVLLSRNEATERGFTEFGGLTGSTHGGFIPTGETAAFIISGDDLASRFGLMHLFEGDHFFSLHNILHLSQAGPGEPALSGALTISRECLHWLTTGVERKPRFNNEFPARLLETRLDWDDLVLPQSTLEQLGEIRDWALYGNRLMEEWDMERKLQPGYMSLFHGPPGTGKTLSACLLGKHCNRDVYKIDLGMIVSKYIGETEKNLARVFDMAEHKDWILFFDEADALFGKRTKVEDAHDRYANQETSFLLQRVEEFGGIVILASNLKSNIDDAFLRRFQSVVSFQMPRPAERLSIWKNAFSPMAELEDGLDLARLAERYELSGGTIMNVVRYCSIKALSRSENRILLRDIEEGIRKEFMKEGRAV